MLKHLVSLGGLADAMARPGSRIAARVLGCEGISNDSCNLYRTVMKEFEGTQARTFVTSPIAEAEQSSEEAIDRKPASKNGRTRRTGLIGVKVGMTQEWDHWGALIPLSVLWIDECQVVQVKTLEKEGYLALQVGCGNRREKQMPFSLRGHFNAAGVPLKRKLAEFKITEDCMLPVGTLLSASHFVPGQYVDISGTSIGKGFQGVMKRWGFAGQPASHGNSLSHRAPGSVGGCQDPGKVFKGKKLPGRMGGKRRTVQNCFVWRVDPDRGLIYVRGQVPGHRGNFVLIRDSVKKLSDQQPDLPIPTSLNLETGISIAPKLGLDPYRFAEQ